MRYRRDRYVRSIDNRFGGARERRVRRRGRNLAVISPRCPGSQFSSGWTSSVDSGWWTCVWEWVKFRDRERFANDERRSEWHRPGDGQHRRASRSSSKQESLWWLARVFSVARLRFSRAEAADRCARVHGTDEQPLPSMGYQYTRSSIWIFWIDHEKVSTRSSLLPLYIYWYTYWP